MLADGISLCCWLGGLGGAMMLYSSLVGLWDIEQVIRVGGPILRSADWRGLAEFRMLRGRGSGLFVRPSWREGLLRSVAFPSHGEAGLKRSGWGKSVFRGCFL